MKKYIKPEIEIIECEPFYEQYTSTCHQGWRHSHTGKWKPGNMADEGWDQFKGKDHGVWEWVDAKQSTFWEEEEDI